MYDIRCAEQADLGAVIALLARLQADPAHHIGYLGETPSELTADLAGFEPSWAASSVVAVDETGRLCGVLGVDVAPRRARLHGPFVDVPLNHPAGSRIWDQTADALHAAAVGLPRLRVVADRELCGRTEHRRLAAFARRHGFAADRASGVLVADGDALRSLLLREAGCPRTGPARQMRSLPTDPAVHEAVAVLHERCFPGAHPSGRQLVERARGHTVVVAMDGDDVLGYAAGTARPQEHHVDFVAVEPALRGRGVGAALITELVWELAAARGARPRVVAAVLAGNDSRRTFDRLGFELREELVAYRTRPAA
ncbi:GNAT family N-acetyltransferase [Umezawaea beigongshangensis]|uniref:GNAT family N-acetyltransferase n=1 Tax=Umezawaea beigongshangensis TaxID=2780383 RepID=UPI0018F19324|nr:GNAT family N-acetyltransferase [Umezawaea beigongshangensis]